MRVKAWRQFLMCGGAYFIMRDLHDITRLRRGLPPSWVQADLAY